MSISKKIVCATLLAGSLYAAIIGILSFPTPQRCMIYLHWLHLPAKFDVPEYYGFAHNKARNVRLATADNLTIGAWHFMPTDYFTENAYLREDVSTAHDAVFDAALADPRYDTVVYFHGNAMSRVAPWRIDLYKALQSRFGKLNIITIDYRGFGDSEGVPSEEGLRLDAQATIDWLVARQVDPQRITLIGHSLGTGVATALAYDMTKQGTPPKALVLKAPYSSLPSLIFEYRMLEYIPILAPLQLVPPMQNWLLSKLMHTFDSLSKIEHVGCPILIVYGASDLEIPGHHSHQLFHRALYGASTPIPYSKNWLVDDATVVHTTIPNEAALYTSQTQRSDVQLLRLEFADHNNVGYFEATFKATADLAGWQR